MQAQETFYQLNSLREKFRGTQSLAQERSRFLAEEAEEARTAGRDPEALEAEAQILRGEESQLQTVVQLSRNNLTQASQALSAAEAALVAEENRIAAALRAIADQREGTARQEGHIKSLAARLDAISEEIARLTKARDEAANRRYLAQREYATHELEIASADSGELGLDAAFESAKSALATSRDEHQKLVDAERIADRSRNAIESKLEALELSAQSRNGAAALLREPRGLATLGSLASLIEIDAGWENAVAAALGQLADAIVVQDISAAITALSTLRSLNVQFSSKTVEKIMSRERGQALRLLY